MVPRPPPSAQSASPASRCPAAAPERSPAAPCGAAEASISQHAMQGYCNSPGARAHTRMLCGTHFCIAASSLWMRLIAMGLGRWFWNPSFSPYRSIPPRSRSNLVAVGAAAAVATTTAAATATTPRARRGRPIFQRCLPEIFSFEFFFSSGRVTPRTWRGGATEQAKSDARPRWVSRQRQEGGWCAAYAAIAVPALN